MTRSGTPFRLAAWGHLAIAALIVLFGLLLRIRHFDHELDGPHLFRQAHVARDIERILESGPTMRPGRPIESMPWSVFDGPVYQNAVAGICRATGLGVVPAGRLASLLTYLLSSVVLLSILRATGCRQRAAELVLLVYVLSPLSVYYDRGLVPDNLATLLSFVSLLGFLRWRAAGSAGAARRHYAVMLSAGVVATFVKSPVFLPVCVAMIFCLAVTEWRRLLSPSFLLFLSGIGATVVVFALYSNWVNTGAPLRSPPGQTAWYFGTLELRTSLGPYKALLRRAYLQLTPQALPLTLLGVAWTVARGKLRPLSIYFGLLLGAAASVLLFFNVHALHNYYQIPFVFVLSVFAGIFVDDLCTKLEEGLGDAAGRGAARTLVAIVAISLATAWFAFKIHPRQPEDQIAAGQVIQSSTSESSFIVYVVDAAPYEDYDPSNLYFARRAGYNLRADECTADRLRELAAAFSTGGREVVLFLPRQHRRDLEAVPAAIGAPLIAETQVGALYEL